MAISNGVFDRVQKINADIYQLDVDNPTEQDKEYVQKEVDELISSVINPLDLCDPTQSSQEVGSNITMLARAVEQIKEEQLKAYAFQKIRKLFSVKIYYHDHYTLITKTFQYIEEEGCLSFRDVVNKYREVIREIKIPILQVGALREMFKTLDKKEECVDLALEVAKEAYTAAETRRDEVDPCLRGKPSEASNYLTAYAVDEMSKMLAKSHLIKRDLNDDDRSWIDTRVRLGNRVKTHRDLFSGQIKTGRWPRFSRSEDLS